MSEESSAIIRRVAAEMGLPKKALRIVCADRDQAEAWERVYREWRKRVRSNLR